MRGAARVERGEVKEKAGIKAEEGRALWALERKCLKRCSTGERCVLLVKDQCLREMSTEQAAGSSSTASTLERSLAQRLA